jgi:hypothetical protein
MTYPRLSPGLLKARGLALTGDAVIIAVELG